MLIDATPLKMAEKTQKEVVHGLPGHGGRNTHEFPLPSQCIVASAFSVLDNLLLIHC